MPSIEVLGRREQNASVACGNLLVNLWRGPVTVADIRMAFDAGRALAARHPEGIASLNAVKMGLRLPDEESRNESARTLTESNKWLLATAAVLEGEGFLASAARATYTALQVAVRARYPQKVFGEVAPACAWLAVVVRLELAPSVIQEVVEKASLELDDATRPAVIFAAG